MSLDLRPILEGWDYHPGKVTVRRIKGIDGKDKIQMRLQLGTLQMETSGRPDGSRPYGCDSLLEYFTSIIEKMKADSKDDQFELGEQECADLRDEALQYYYRYLSLFNLEDYSGVARDTERNLEVFDLVKTYAKTDADKFSLEQHRPYVVTMNARGRANLALKENDFNAAYKALHEGMDEIRKFFVDFGQPNLAEKSEEFKTLDKQAGQLRDRLPRDPLGVLRERLKVAVKEQRFEEAARLRDKIRKLEESAR
ncbi:MAG TPA: UvrB/UvrC motif-containing protein [Terriglobia bacterium]|nr:UvrB/UvrC motif-containing protein [Terriglobia bacterium]